MIQDFNYIKNRFIDIEELSSDLTVFFTSCCK